MYTSFLCFYFSFFFLKYLIRHRLKRCESGDWHNERMRSNERRYRCWFNTVVVDLWWHPCIDGIILTCALTSPFVCSINADKVAANRAKFRRWNINEPYRLALNRHMCEWSECLCSGGDQVLAVDYRWLAGFWISFLRSPLNALWSGVTFKISQPFYV